MLAFFRQVIKNYKTTGAVFPSSVVLARAMTKSIHSHSSGPKRILEVGPGTGAFTRLILDALEPGDECHIVEINPSFAEHLHETTLAPFQREHPDIQVILYIGAIEDATLEPGFEYIVCGLPFNSFPLHIVSRIFRKILPLLAEGGELTYFEYFGMKAVKWPWVGSHGRNRLRRRIAMERVFKRRHAGYRDVVIRNITPARAIHLSGCP